MTKKFSLLFLLLSACNGSFDPSGERIEGLGETLDTQGPKVVFDVLARPLPESHCPMM